MTFLHLIKFNYILHALLSKVKYLTALNDFFRDGDEYRYIEDEEVDSAPNFDVKPQPATIGEGSPVKFLVRVSGKPTPQLTWYLNDEPIEQVRFMNWQFNLIPILPSDMNLTQINQFQCYVKY